MGEIIVFVDISVECKNHCVISIKVNNNLMECILMYKIGNVKILLLTIQLEGASISYNFICKIV